MKRALKRRIETDATAARSALASVEKRARTNTAPAASDDDADDNNDAAPHSDDIEKRDGLPGDGETRERLLFERRRNMIARAAIANDKEALRALMDRDCTARHIKSALYRVIDDCDAVKAICKVATAGRRRLQLAGRLVYRAASRLHTESTLVLVAFAYGRRAKAVKEALARLIDDDEAEPIECLFTACAASESGIPQHKRDRWACDGLCEAAARGRPMAAEALAREVSEDDMERIIHSAASLDKGDVVAGLFEACAEVVAPDTWARWAFAVLCEAAERDRLCVIDHVVDIARPADVREALLRCAGPRRRVDAFEMMWEFADMCVHDFIRHLPEGVGRDHLYDLIDDDVGCEGYCTAAPYAPEQDDATDGDDRPEARAGKRRPIGRYAP
ncbi:hypothetical protein pkur_cds_735 [Pandoravirus kuranda]|uniref:Uncharacterized protein n=1 Tax=Pandoravirus kuranda TaxID=3019033 RepID=A0AA95J2G3_9VIRU|nr:hypothetical protein pkur_cds_735 [Pandoravirus kuranda]